jgi:hypothetical protein
MGLSQIDITSLRGQKPENPKAVLFPLMPEAISFVKPFLSLRLLRFTRSDGLYGIAIPTESGEAISILIPT